MPLTVCGKRVEVTRSANEILYAFGRFHLPDPKDERARTSLAVFLYGRSL